MFRKLGLPVLCIAATLTTHAFAATHNYALQVGATLEYVLPPNEPQIFSNYMFWTVDADCKITSPDEGNILYAVALAKKGKLNDIPWTKGDSLRVTVHNGEILKISAEAGAQVSITNEGASTVIATCSN